MAMDMLDEKLIGEKEAVMRLSPAQLDELLHPILDPKAEKKAEVIVKGLPAGPGGAVGQIVFSSEKAMELAARKVPASWCGKRPIRKMWKACAPPAEFSPRGAE